MSSRTTNTEWIDELEQTLEGFDETGGHRVLGRVFAELDLENALSDVVLPYLHSVGERWSQGAIGVAQEHFASNVLRSRLSLLMNAEARTEGPLAVLACMPEEHHEFGLMAMSLALSRLGWRVCYLGADTPIPELAVTCRTLRPEAVVLSAHRRTAFEAHGPVLRRIAASTSLHVAGPGASDHVSELCHASYLDGDPVWAARAVHDELGGTRPDLDAPSAV
ncbi:MAG: B12-binding domain-containing protein [Terrabacter sp.]